MNVQQLINSPKLSLWIQCFLTSFKLRENPKVHCLSQSMSRITIIYLTQPLHITSCTKSDSLATEIRILLDSLISCSIKLQKKLISSRPTSD